MSQPPPYGAPAPENPDRRPLPPGWIQQYDANYKTWFYVNTQENPPRSSWVHPLGSPGSPAPPNNFAPPPGVPPRDQYGSGPGYNQGPPQQQWGPSGGYNGGYQQGYGGPQGGYGGPPQGGYGGPGGYQGGYQQGAPQGRGWFGGNSQPQPVYEQAPPKKSGMGMGTALAAGGAGVLGGLLIGDMVEDHIQDDERDAYQDGYDNGAQDYGDGGDGGDW